MLPFAGWYNLTLHCAFTQKRAVETHLLTYPFWVQWVRPCPFHIDTFQTFYILVVRVSTMLGQYINATHTCPCLTD